tara:strand:+ start:923 stop:1339 length:417 start_codon:yes stop_codon:yes gene_type:complete
MAYIQSSNPFKKKKTQIVGAKDNRASQTVGVGQGYLDQLSKDKTDYMGNLKKYQGSYIQQPVESTMPAVNVSPDIGNFRMTKNSKNRKQSLAAAEAKASYGGGSLSRRQKIRLAKGGGKAERQLRRIQKKAARRAKRA